MPSAVELCLFTIADPGRSRSSLGPDQCGERRFVAASPWRPPGVGGRSRCGRAIKRIAGSDVVAGEPTTGYSSR